MIRNATGISCTVGNNPYIQESELDPEDTTNDICAYYSFLGQYGIRDGFQKRSSHGRSRYPYGQHRYFRHHVLMQCVSLSANRSFAIYRHRMSHSIAGRNMTSYFPTANGTAGGNGPNYVRSSGQYSNSYN